MDTEQGMIYVYECFDLEDLVLMEKVYIDVSKVTEKIFE